MALFVLWKNVDKHSCTKEQRNNKLISNISYFSRLFLWILAISNVHIFMLEMTVPHVAGVKVSDLTLGGPGFEPSLQHHWEFASLLDMQRCSVSLTAISPTQPKGQYRYKETLVVLQSLLGFITQQRVSSLPFLYHQPIYDLLDIKLELAMNIDTPLPTNFALIK